MQVIYSEAENKDGEAEKQINFCFYPVLRAIP
jgi:hypothetical protein